MKAFQRGIFIFCAAVAFSSCASITLDQQLDEKLAREPSKISRADLDAKITALAKTTPGLTPQQRERLLSVKAGVQKKLAENNSESLRLRSLLLKDILAPGENSREVAMLKTHVVALGM